MTREQARRLRQGITPHVLAFAEAQGLTLEIGSTRFDSGTVTFKITLSEPGASEAQAESDYRALCPLYGLDSNDFCKGFVVAGSTYKIVAIIGRRPKSPILIERADGKRFKTSAEFVLRILHPDRLCRNCHRFRGCTCRPSEKAIAAEQRARTEAKMAAVQTAIAAARRGAQE